MSDQDNFDSFLTEMMASMSEDTRGAMLRRVNAERRLKLVAEDLLEKHEAESIRVIPDNRLTDQDAADYLFQVDDYDLRLVLLDSPDGEVRLTEQLVQDWIALLETNPSTTILVSVWANADLAAIPFTMKRLQALAGSSQQITKIAAIAKPFEIVITEQIKRQTKGWKIPKVEPNKPLAGKRDLFSIFSQKIIHAIDNEASRRYRTEERSKAAKNFPAEQEKRLLLNILREALDGAASRELESQLTKLPRRGGQ